MTTRTSNRKKGLTNPGSSTALEEGELPLSTVSLSFEDNRKRKQDFVTPGKRPKKAKKAMIPKKKGPTEKQKQVSAEKKERALEKENKEMKIDQMFAWFQDQQRMNRRSR